MGLGFLLGFFHAEKGILRLKTTRRKTWFLLDLLTLIPFDLFNLLAGDTGFAEFKSIKARTQVVLGYTTGSTNNIGSNLTWHLV